MTEEEAEYTRCVQVNHADYARQTWCGKRLDEGFVFQGVEHAAYNAMNQGRLLTCPDCQSAIVSALVDGQSPVVAVGGES